MKLKFSDSITIFYGSIESLSIDTKEKHVKINTISGSTYRKKFDSVEEAIDYLDDLAEKIAPTETKKAAPKKTEKPAPKKPAKKTNKKKAAK